MDIALDEVIHFDAITSHPSTGAATDADSTPTFSVFEEATDTPILSAVNFTKRTSLTGNYRGTATLSAGNGFEVGKWYSIVASATVNAIAGKGVVRNFRVVPAEAVAGYPKVDTQYVEGIAPDSALDISTEVFARTFSVAYGSLTFDQMIKLMAAVLVGKASGLATTTATYRNLADTGDVVVATVDANGNRSAVTRTP